MTLLREVQPRIYILTGGLFANWMPPDKVDVGDYGVLAGERFVRDGNLRHWDVSYEVEALEKSAGKLEYSDRAKVRGGMSVESSADIIAQRKPKARATIKLSGRGAFLYHLAGISTERVANSRVFFEDLALKWIAGEVTLEANSVIVNEVRRADSATIVVSDAQDGMLNLEGDLTFGTEAIFADVKGGLSIANHSGSIFKWLSVDGTTPIIGLIRPVMGPPDDGGGTPQIGPVATFLQWVRDLFTQKKWTIRDIQLRDYVSRPGDKVVAGVVAVLPDGSTVAVSFLSVSADDLLSLSDEGAQSPVLIEDTIPSINLRQDREASG